MHRWLLWLQRDRNELLMNCSKAMSLMTTAPRLRDPIVAAERALRCGWRCMALLGGFNLATLWTTAACAMPPAHSPQSDESSSLSGAQIAEQGKKKEQAKNAQVKDEALQMTSSSTSQSPSHLTNDFMNDQKHIWTSPARVRFSDATWLVPVGGLTAGLFVADRQFSAHLSKNPQRLNRYAGSADRRSWRPIFLGTDNA